MYTIGVAVFVVLGSITAPALAAQPDTEGPAEELPSIGPIDGSSGEPAESGGAGVDTGVILAIVLSVVALLVAVVALTRRSSRGNALPLARASAEPWRDQARAAAEEGGLIVDLMVAAESETTEGRLDAALPTDLEERLDLFVSELTRASAAAPTAMDSRVTRAAGVRSEVLKHAVQAQRRSEGAKGSGSAGGVERPGVAYRQRRQEFETAVRDLRQHADLF